MSWYLAVLKNYANFSGRARREEYWTYVLFHALAIIMLYAISLATLVLSAGLEGGPAAALAVAGTLPLIAYGLGTVVPTLAVVVRRLHDTGRTGWWYLIAFVPFGGIVLLLFMVWPGDPHGNRHGPSPKPVPESPLAMRHREPNAPFASRT
ncbi:DUF805 domain-containing protein [Glycomyces sp. TRM65418]|uniref:DUF805 domain-containing protein n=1 Tax=Glycomyces sp. TRM65418 TaxID=2867006 RepID=UPI001CE66740|nr:DUF805 domain-containing protein [Glycomyces sp. TRM65418]MCC3763499.1 DUF805 domain-containing protein [Glycomyces sp. TRM65418]QZD57483.1 DUF805 domain-containing protein [Glycomyces sp. TRM65418]